MALSRRTVALGAMGFTVLIYGSNFVITRHALINGLTAYDIVALRFLVAGSLMLPFFLRFPISSCGGLGWRRGLVISVLSGVPMVLLMNLGLSLAPAAHGASITPGTVTVVSAVGGMLMFGAVLSRQRLVALVLVILGLACFALAGGAQAGGAVLLGDLCFVGAGLIWGFYPLMVQRWSLDPLKATAALSVLSMAYLPFYLLLADSRLAEVPLGVVLFHAINQGVFNVIVGLWIWAWAARVLGAAVVGRFPPLVPVIGNLLAAPVLGELLKPWQIVGVVLVVGGLVYSAWVPPQPRKVTDR